MSKPLFFACIAVVASIATAAPALSEEGTGPSTPQDKPPGWVAGVGVLSRPDPFVGDTDSKVLPFPLLGYVGKDLTWFGPYFNYKVLHGEKLPWSVAVTANYRFEGFDEKQDDPLLAGLESRDGAFEVGTELRLAAFSLGATADVTDTHGGFELYAGAEHTFPLGDRFQLGGSLAVRWKNRDLADYYYGVRPEESTPERPAYAVGSALTYGLGVNTSYLINDRIRANLSAAREWLGDEIADSPIVDRKTQLSAVASLVVQLRHKPSEKR